MHIKVGGWEHTVAMTDFFIWKKYIYIGPYWLPLYDQHIDMSQNMFHSYMFGMSWGKWWHNFHFWGWTINGSLLVWFIAEVKAQTVGNSLVTLNKDDFW